MSEKTWFVYLVRDKNASLYCGVTDHVIRRFRQHQAGKGAKFLRGKTPLTLEWIHIVDSKSVALKLEHKIKSLTKIKKEKIVAGGSINNLKLIVNRS